MQRGTAVEARALAATAVRRGTAYPVDLRQELREAGRSSSAGSPTIGTTSPVMCQPRPSAQLNLTPGQHSHQPAGSSHAAVGRPAGVGGTSHVFGSQLAPLWGVSIQCAAGVVLTGVALERAGHSSERRRRTARDRRIHPCCQLLRRTGLSCRRCRPSARAASWLRAASIAASPARARVCACAMTHVAGPWPAAAASKQPTLCTTVASWKTPQSLLTPQLTALLLTPAGAVHTDQCITHHVLPALLLSRLVLHRDAPA